MELCRSKENAHCATHCRRSKVYRWISHLTVSQLADQPLRFLYTSTKSSSEYEPGRASGAFAT